MRLTMLEPRWLRYERRIETYRVHRSDGYADNPNHRHTDGCWEEVTGPRDHMPWAQSAVDAQGVEFLCPKCFAAHAGPIGTHGVIVWFRGRGVPDDVEPGAARPVGHEKSPKGRPAQRWDVSGTNFEDLTIKPSIALEGCAWHGFITNGEAA